LLLFDRYADPVEIGRGASGVVYRATDTETGRVVAIKRILEDSSFPLGRVRREVDATRKLDHPGVVKILELIERLPAEVALVMELVEGGDLEARIATRGAYSLAEGLGLGRALAGILEHAHGRRVVHRDLKPANVLLDRDGSPRLTDFGLALATDLSSISVDARALGTYDYMAPEQRKDAHSADARADVFSFGKTLYRVLTALPPHTVRESAIPAPARDVVLRCLEERPERRFASMSELAAALERELGSSSGRAQPVYELVALDKHDRVLERFPLKDGTNYIGVASDLGVPEVDLTNVDKHHLVSRRHALVDVGRGGVTLLHLSSTNPTHLNGRIVRPAETPALSPGDRVVLSTNVLLEVRRAT
jgi:serine/threonine protein kinase